MVDKGFLTCNDAFGTILKYLLDNVEKFSQELPRSTSQSRKISREFDLEDIFENVKDNISKGYQVSDSYLNVVFDAVLTICRMGIIRKSNGPASYQNYLPFRYCLTEQGLEWLKKWKQENNLFLYQSPSHFSEILKRFHTRFGDFFILRATEACKTYDAQCYLASCVMSGAAAESVILRIAIENDKEENVLKKYLSRNGTREVKKDVREKIKNDFDKRKFDSFFELITYYRNSNGHGWNEKADEFIAYDSLTRLIRLCNFVEDAWGMLTNK